MNNKVLLALILCVFTSIIGLAQYIDIKAGNSLIQSVNNYYSQYKHEYTIYIDLTKSQQTKRMYIYDYNTLIDTLYVADGHSPPFSNTYGSHQSSIGVYLTGKTHIGRHGLERELHGLNPGYNSNAYGREILIHSADYVLRGGKTWGCFAVTQDKLGEILYYTKPGTLVIAYYPDRLWGQYE